MLSILLCLAAFLAAYTFGRRSLTGGLVVVLTTGYAYGIVRANLGQAAAHFLFDAAVLGLYLGQWLAPWSPEERRRVASLTSWVLVLTLWPLVIFLLPYQTPLIQLVGLRGNVFFLPFLILGARLRDDELPRLSLTLAGLNLMAFAFALGEYTLGIERFYPYNAVTDLIYRSNDLLNHAHRIPATFVNAHAYAGTMALTLPFLLGAWAGRPARGGNKMVLAGGIFAAILGVFMAAARIHAVILFVLLATALFVGRWKPSRRLGWVLILIAAGWLVAGQQRLQRFTTLQDTDFVTTRISGSINKRFLDLLEEYPLGNGLGGGGTSVPYFLQSRLRDPIVMENEYARILLEQGIPGLVLAIAFLIWVFSRRTINPSQTHYLCRRLAWVAAAAYFAIGLLGVGLLTSVPQSGLLLLATGWIAVRPLAAARAAPHTSPAPAAPYGHRLRGRPLRSSP